MLKQAKLKTAMVVLLIDRASRGDAEAIRFDGEEPQIRGDLGKIACSQLLKDRVEIMRKSQAA